jgi:hypothetical protein
MFIKYNTSCGISFLANKFIMQNDPSPHSAFFFGKYDSASYSWLHMRNESERITLKFSDRDPHFVRIEDSEKRKGNSD